MNIESELDDILKKKKMGSCEKCGGEYVSNRMGRYTCKKCGHEVLDDEGKVREYLRKNGAAPYMTVQKDTGASREILNKFRTDRF